jgi:hypothetical protein
MKKNLAFYLLQNGFQVFRRRLEQELMVCRGVSLAECSDDESLFHLYQNGEPTSYVIDRLCGAASETD